MQATKPSVGGERVPVEADAISSFSRQQNQSTVGRDSARDDRSLDDFQQYPQSAEVLRVESVRIIEAKSYQTGS